MRTVPELTPPPAIAERTEAPVVEVLRCPVCQGDGWFETRMSSIGLGLGRECRACCGSGFVATNGGEP